MAGTDTQKQLLSLIRDFASEKSRGERRVVGLKKRIEELQSELDAANAELEDAKRLKEATEQELNGYEVESALNDATIQALEARISQAQDEISVVGNEVDGLKNEEELLRDQFIDQMSDLNKEIRKFHQAVTSSLEKDDTIADIKAPEDGYEIASENLEYMLASINSQIANEEQEYLAEQNRRKQLQMELDESEKKVSLMEAIMEEMKSLQDLTRQTSDLEQALASLGEELKQKCMCPQCGAENLETLGQLLQGN